MDNGGHVRDEHSTRIPGAAVFTKVRLHCADSGKPLDSQLRDLCAKWVERRMDDVNLVIQSAEILHEHPLLFVEMCSIEAFRSSFTASCSTLNGRIDLVNIRVHGVHAGWSILPISPSAKKDPSFTVARQLERSDLEELVHDRDLASHPFMSTDRWTKILVEVLACEARSSKDFLDQPDFCARTLRKIVTRTGFLPSRFYVRDLIREGNNAVTGGGFSDIWQGRLYGETVCLKVLRIFLSDASRDKVLKDFCREALVWKDLDHKNVLPFLGVNVDLFAPSFCIVLPWMANGNINTYFEALNPDMPRREVAVYEIAQGIEYLHKQTPPIVHGDIRGANVLVKDDGCCCLADFGLAAVSETRTLTATSHMRGSTRWMAPELLETHRQDPKGYPSRDVYAFACTALEVMTGNAPFADVRYEVSVSMKVLNRDRPPRPPSSIISKALWHLIEVCWAQNAKHRPEMEVVVSDLHDIIQGEVREDFWKFHEPKKRPNSWEDWDPDSWQDSA